MELGLTGSVAVVTGAASGIGRACALALAAEGATVGAIDRDVLAGEALAGELRGAFAAADVADESQVHAAMDAIAERLGRIDLLVCCAGISGPFGRPIDRISAQEFTAVLAVNVTGAFLAVKHAVPHLRSSEHPAVMLMGSDSSFVAASGMVPYNASKGAVLQLTRALAVELAAEGIRVNCVCPSVVDTPMARADLEVTDFASADFPVQSPDEVARHVVYLASPASRPVNGTSLVSDFGYLARSSFPA